MATWLKVPQAALYAGVSRDTIYTACERNELRHVRVGGRRAIRLNPEWIDEWLERFARGAVRESERPRVTARCGGVMPVRREAEPEAEVGPSA